MSQSKQNKMQNSSSIDDKHLEINVLQYKRNTKKENGKYF